MTDLRTAAQQALDFCEFLWREVAMNDYAEEKREAVEAALRAALADQDRGWYTIDEINAKFDPEPVQEPVAWLFTDIQSGDIEVSTNPDEKEGERERWNRQPLYKKERNT